MMPVPLYIIFLLPMVLAVQSPRHTSESAHAAQQGGETYTARCHCQTDQWQGMQLTTTREFDLHGGQTNVAETVEAISVDYTNGRMAKRDLRSGKRSIQFYNKGVGYRIYDNGLCLQTSRKLQRMDKKCYLGNENVAFDGVYSIGGDGVDIEMSAVEIGPNMTARITMATDTCLPITEEVFGQVGAYAMSQSIVYLDTTVGISNEEEFDVPRSCKSREDFIQAMRHNQP